MSATLRILLAVFCISLIGTAAQARDNFEAELLLKDALMESNADYNKHKKKFNHEEMDRADNWSDRSSASIDLNGNYTAEEIAEFQQINKDFTMDERQVSSFKPVETLDTK